MMKPVPPAPYASYTICREQQHCSSNATPALLDKILTHVYNSRSPAHWCHQASVHFAEGLLWVADHTS